MSGKTRSVFKIVLTNFINSLKPRQISGTLKGTDYNGTKYYEIPPNPSIGKRKTSRWFEPVEDEKFDQELPAEWEAWLRGRRKEPPTDEEILKNLEIMKLKKVNAAKLDAMYAAGKTGGDAKPAEVTTGIKSFPQYKEFEIMPGKSVDEK